MTKFTDAGDVDLDNEVVLRRDGTRITEKDATEQGERIAKDGPGRTGGRPSLSGKAKRSPQIGVRLPVDLKARLDARAEREHKRPSDIVREALEHFV